MAEKLACLPGGSSITSFKQRFAIFPLRQPVLHPRPSPSGWLVGNERAFLGAAGLGVASPPASGWLHTIARCLGLPSYDLNPRPPTQVL